NERNTTMLPPPTDIAAAIDRIDAIVTKTTEALRALPEAIGQGTNTRIVEKLEGVIANIQRDAEQSKASMRVLAARRAQIN
ncbi:MAG TPA: hypothetical protein VG713_09820, partial [Pirellulales bacterium]|nr:hypothetical protein [Pirellulales bacterium]